MTTERKLVKRAELDGKAFRRWREKLGWTQVEAAQWFEVHPRTYQGWEEGRRQYHSDRMIAARMRQAKPKKPVSTDTTLFD